MCVAVIGRNLTERYPFIIVSNRDEFRGRETRRAGFWDDGSGIVAGRDMEKGGTWLGVTRSGRAALVTNFREPNMQRGQLSRGVLVSDFLSGRSSTGEYLSNIEDSGGDYSGYNLIVFDGTDVGYASNRGGENVVLNDGAFGVSNHLLDTPWRKVTRSKERVVNQIGGESLPVESIIDVMRDESKADDSELPSTGVPFDLERRLSSIFIEGGKYGTRCTSVLAIRYDGRILFTEQNYDATSAVIGRNTFVV